MSLFGNLTTQGLEENQDRAGGSYSALETDLYTGKIKVAYAGQSSGGARNVTLIIAGMGGQEYRETVYVTDRNGKNFFLSKDAKNDDGTPKKIALPGFTVIDDICQVCTDKPLAEQNGEDKIVNIWDYEAKKELPKSVPVLVDLIGKDVLLAVKKSIVNVNEKNGAGEYVPTDKERDENTIEKVFHPTARCTVVEAKKAAAEGKPVEAAFIDVWLEKNKGRTHDKRSNKGGNGQSGQARTSAANSGGPPQGGNGSATRKSLFGGQQAA